MEVSGRRLPNHRITVRPASLLGDDFQSFTALTDLLMPTTCLLASILWVNKCKVGQHLKANESIGYIAKRACDESGHGPALTC